MCHLNMPSVFLSFLSFVVVVLLFLTHMESVGPCNDRCYMYQTASKLAIFSDTINMINVKLCVMVALLSFSHSYHIQLPCLCSWVTAESNNFDRKLYVLI